MLHLEQPPISLEADVRDYLMRMFRQIDDRFIRRDVMPRVTRFPAVGDVPGTMAYFPLAIPGTPITSEGLWFRDSTGWVKMSTQVGSGVGAVSSVNGEVGDVVLDYADVGAAPISHTHLISQVTNLQQVLDGKAALVHGHTIADTTGLQAALDGKAATVHSHAIADVTGLQTALNNKQNFHVVNVKDYGAVGDGVSDDTQAFKNAIAAVTGSLANLAGGTIHIPNGTYKLTDTLVMTHITLRGDGWGTILQGDIVDAAKPILEVGGSVKITDLSVQFLSTRLTGLETKGQRVAIKLFNSTNDAQVFYGSILERLLVGYCGTGFYNPNVSGKASNVFSARFSTIYVTLYTYRGFDIRGATRTGNIWENIYVGNAGLPVAATALVAGRKYRINSVGTTNWVAVGAKANVECGFTATGPGTGTGNARTAADCGFAMDVDDVTSTGSEGSTFISQLNVERIAFLTAAVIFKNVNGLACQNIHLEKNVSTDVSQPQILMNNVSGSIEAISFVNCPISHNFGSIVKFNETKNPYSTPRQNTYNYFRIGHISEEYIGYDNTGITNLNFAIFSRGVDDGPMFVELQNLAYSGGYTDYTTWATCPIAGNITLMNNGRNHSSQGRRFIPGYVGFQDRVYIGNPVAGSALLNVQRPSNGQAAQFSVNGSSGGGAVINVTNGQTTDTPIYGFWFDGGTGLGNPAIGEISILSGSAERARWRSNGCLRLATQSSDPPNPNAGDVYLNSAYRLRVYNGSAWVDL